MGEAREITDRLLDAYIAGDRDALVRLYATDAVAETPDAPRIEGGTAIVDYTAEEPGKIMHELRRQTLVIDDGTSLPRTAYERHELT